MTRARSWWFAVLLVGALGLPTAARAGVVIVTESEEPGDAVGKSGQPPAASAKAANDPAAKDKRRLTGLLYASGTDVRMEGTRTDADEKESGTVLFRGANDTLIVIDDQEKTYFEITRADAKRLASSLESARAQIRAQMENMSAEDRAAVEQAMKEFGGLGSAGQKKEPAPLKAVATGKTSSVEGRSCREFEVQRGGKRIAEACVASWSDTGLKPDDLVGLRKLAEFQREVLSAMNWEGLEAAPGAEVFELLDEVGGFPVRVRATEDGETVEFRVKDIQRKDIDPKLFQVPAGYERAALPG
ncbi:MAG TPA: DUF4412 domain-containing protein [Candidatus Binatia bacterium]